MVEPDFEQRRERGISGNVAADAVVVLVLVRHHRHGVPARQALDAPLQRTVARIWNLLFGRDRVDVGRVVLDGEINANLPCALRNVFQNEGGPVRT